MKNDYNLNEVLVENSVFTIGSVFSVDGKEILVKVYKDKNLPHLFYKGRTLKNVSVGLSNYVKILKGFTEIICKVEGEYLEEDKYQKNKEYINEKEKIERFLNVSVFGFYDSNGAFQHGIKEMPLIGGECRLLTRQEFESLHNLTKNEELSIIIGSLIDEETQNIKLSVNGLFAGHIGIFGNTGSGKSNTLAKIYTELFRLNHLNDDFRFKSRFIFIDFNGEYSCKEEDDSILIHKSKKEVYKMRTRGSNGRRYPMLKKEIQKLELLSILLDATEKTQQPFLHRALDTNWFKDSDNYEMELKSIQKKLSEILQKKDKNFNIPFLKKFITDFENLGFKIIRSGKDIDAIKYHGHDKYSFYFFRPSGTKAYSDANEDEFFDTNGLFDIKTEESMSLSPLQQIKFKILDQYYFEILNGYANQEHIGPLMGRVHKRFEMLNLVFDILVEQPAQLDCNVEVIDLKNVDLEIKKVIPLLICKTNYDEQKNRRDVHDKNSLHIIIDEAHTILSENSNRESESWKDYRLDTFEEIIKEGRKFGVFLTIASQRPSDISPTIISQLHNYFIHRLMNENDLKAINKAVSYLDKLSFDSISNLSVGCCFIAGQLTKFPLSLKVSILDEKIRPNSETIDLDELWRRNSSNESSVEESDNI